MTPKNSKSHFCLEHRILAITTYITTAPVVQLEQLLFELRIEALSGVTDK